MGGGSGVGVRGGGGQGVEDAEGARAMSVYAESEVVFVHVDGVDGELEG